MVSWAEFAGRVITNLTKNAAFPDLPVPVADLTKLQTGFSDAVQAALDGGVSLTAAKNAAREALLMALRKTAAYVQIVACQDLALLLTFGFTANSTNRAQTKLDVPSIVAVDNEGTTKLSVRLQPVDNARAYQVRASTGNNGTTTWLPTVDATQTRRIVVGNLAPGTTYTFQALGRWRQRRLQRVE